MSNIFFFNEFVNILHKYTGEDYSFIKDLVEIPIENSFGDFAFPCFLLSKKYKKSPIEIAKDIETNLSSIYFSKIQANGPYLNVFIDKKMFIKKVFGIQEKTNNIEKVLIEFMAANPNKPLHIGQARNICIGDTLYKLFTHLGYDVHCANYGDDSGVNVGYNVLGHKYYDFPLETDKKYDHYCGQIYTQMIQIQEQENDEEFKKLLSETLSKIENRTDKEINEIQNEYTRRCTIAQFQTCWRLNSFFDFIVWETDILHLNLFKHTIEILKKNGFIKFIQDGEAKGCWVIDLENVDDFKNQEKNYQIVIKSDGVATYVGKDIVFAIWKLGYLNFDFNYYKLVNQPNGKIIYSSSSNPKDIDKPGFGNYNLAITVIDNRQSFAQMVVKGSLQLMGYLNDNKKYIHLGYGVVYITPNTLLQLGFELSQSEIEQSKLPFSSRKGWVVTIDEAFDLLKNKAFIETQKRNSTETDDWINYVAENIALASLRFFLIKSDISKEILFDLDSVLDMEGETGAYVLYTYARINSIIIKSGLELDYIKKHLDVDNLNEDIEFQIVKLIDYGDLVIQKVKENLEPNHLCKYILDLCKNFNLYYSKVRVIDFDNESIMISRLFLLIQIKNTLKIFMNIVGIKELEKM